MKRDEFLSELEDRLSCLSPAQLEEAKRFYDEAIADRMEDGMNEEESVAGIGSPAAAAEAILDDLPVVPRAIAKTRRRSDALLLALAILGSPVWLALLVAFIAVALGVYVCIWAIALCVWAFALALMVSGVTTAALATAGVSAGLVPYTFAMAGCALGLIGAALVIGAGAWVASKQVARISAAWVKKALSPFIKKKGDPNDRTHATARRGGAREIYLVAAVALIVFGILIAFVGFAMVGFDSAIFSTRIDAQTGTAVLGGTKVGDLSNIFPLQQLANLGQVDTSTLAG